MFTGLIEGIGRVVKSQRRQLWIQLPWKRLHRGESIAIDGVCLSVSASRGSIAQFDVGPETLRVTTLGMRRAGERVNLERALRIGDRLGGHWVTGHVEALGRIEAWRSDGPHRWLTLTIPSLIRSFVTAKGSLAVDGISLTVARYARGRATLMLIPHTLSHTTLGSKQKGDAVNLEADILAKYALAGRRGR